MTNIINVLIAAAGQGNQNVDVLLVLLCLLGALLDACFETCEKAIMKLQISAYVQDAYQIWTLRGVMLSC